MEEGGQGKVQNTEQGHAAQLPIWVLVALHFRWQPLQNALPLPPVAIPMDSKVLKATYEVNRRKWHRKFLIDPSLPQLGSWIAREHRPVRLGCIACKVHF